MIEKKLDLKKRIEEMEREQLFLVEAIENNNYGRFEKIEKSICERGGLSERECENNITTIRRIGNMVFCYINEEKEREKLFKKIAKEQIYLGATHFQTLSGLFILYIYIDAKQKSLIESFKQNSMSVVIKSRYKKRLSEEFGVDFSKCSKSAIDEDIKSVYFALEKAGMDWKALKKEKTQSLIKDRNCRFVIFETLLYIRLDNEERALLKAFYEKIYNTRSTIAEQLWTMMQYFISYRIAKDELYEERIKKVSAFLKGLEKRQEIIGEVCSTHELFYESFKNELIICPDSHCPIVLKLFYTLLYQRFWQEKTNRLLSFENMKMDIEPVANTIIELKSYDNKIRAKAEECRAIMSNKNLDEKYKAVNKSQYLKVLKQTDYKFWQQVKSLLKMRKKAASPNDKSKGMEVTTWNAFYSKYGVFLDSIFTDLGKPKMKAMWLKAVKTYIITYPEKFNKSVAWIKKHMPPERDAKWYGLHVIDIGNIEADWLVYLMLYIFKNRSKVYLSYDENAVANARFGFEMFGMKLMTTQKEKELYNDLHDSISLLFAEIPTDFPNFRTGGRLAAGLIHGI